MNLNFPSSPTDGQTYSANGVNYFYDEGIGAWMVVVPSLVEGTTDKQIIFNDSSTSNGSNGLLFDKAANTVYLNEIVVAQNISSTYLFGNGAYLTGIVGGEGETDLGPLTTLSQAAFDKANTANTNADSSFAFANTVNLFAFAARANANAAAIHANSSFIHANSSFIHANASYSFANTVNTFAFAARANANAAAIHANASFVHANSSFTHANSSYSFANTVNTFSFAARANANAAAIHANAAFNFANTVNTFAFAARANANAAAIHANASFEFANTSNIRIYAAYAHANAAFATANTGGGGGSSVTTSDTSPGTPADGDLWWNSDIGKMFVYYEDGDSNQWVEVSPGLAVPTANGEQTAASSFLQANAAFIQANSAFSKANSIFAGKITVSNTAPSSPSINDIWIDIT